MLYLLKTEACNLKIMFEFCCERDNISELMESSCACGSFEMGKEILSLFLF